MLKKISIITLTFITLLFLVSCNKEKPEENNEDKITGIYEQVLETINGFDNTKMYIYKTLELKDDLTFTIKESSYLGVNTEEGNYTVNGDIFTIKMGIREFEYFYNKDDLTLKYEGRINRRDTVMIYKKNNDFKVDGKTGKVAFTGELFGEDLNENFYNYAPTIIMEGNTMHIWYCANKESGNVTDYIAYRKGTLTGDGKWTFTEASLDLSPTPGTWDERHVCDPSVIKGEYLYNGEEYFYLMSYLGVITNDSSRNEVGIAVAKKPEGPWIKIDEVNPIANYYESDEYVDDEWTWGYGQPSLVSVDKKGKALMFYTKGLKNGTTQQVEYWDFSNLNNPIKLESTELANLGVVNSQGAVDIINNADFAYDEVNKRLFMVKEDSPYPSNGKTDWITGSNTILYLNLNLDKNYIGETLFSKSSLRWEKVSSVTKDHTGFDRNHNFGLVTDSYGHMISPYELPLVYTRGDLSENYPDWDLKGQWPSLHTYRLYGYTIKL